MSPKYNPLKFCCRLHHIQEGAIHTYILIKGSVLYFIPSGGENIECNEHTSCEVLAPTEGDPMLKALH